MRYLTVLTLIGMQLGVLTSPTYANHDASEVHEAVAKIKAAIEDLKTNPDCRSVAFERMMRGADYLEQKMMHYYEVSADPNSGNVFGRDARDHLHALTPVAISARFSVADVALALKCYDIADDQYRHVISVFTGASYAAARQRAMIGIEDVRARRAGK